MTEGYKGKEGGRTEGTEQGNSRTQRRETGEREKKDGTRDMGKGRDKRLDYKEKENEERERVKR